MTSPLFTKRPINVVFYCFILFPYFIVIKLFEVRKYTGTINVVLPIYFVYMYVYCEEIFKCLQLNKNSINTTSKILCFGLLNLVQDATSSIAKQLHFKVNQISYCFYHNVSFNINKKVLAFRNLRSVLVYIDLVYSQLTIHVKIKNKLSSCSCLFCSFLTFFCSLM